MLFAPTVIKNLLKKPATRNYPFVKREPFPMYRGELVNDMEKCIFCGMCSRKCPSQCITVEKSTGSWQYDPHACIHCGYCRDNCPTKSLTMKNVYTPPSTHKIMIIEHGNPPKPKKKTVPTKETGGSDDSKADPAPALKAAAAAEAPAKEAPGAEPPKQEAKEPAKKKPAGEKTAKDAKKPGAKKKAASPKSAKKSAKKGGKK